MARYIVTVIEGAIMQARTLGDTKLIARQFGHLKGHLSAVLDRRTARGSRRVRLA